jgi:glutaredoxin
VSAVTVYTARDCHLCARAREQLEQLRRELEFELREVDIGGVPELERAYREWIPVVELGGERVSVYRVDEAELRRRLQGHGARNDR